MLCDVYGMEVRVFHSEIGRPGCFSHVLPQLERLGVFVPTPDYDEDIEYFRHTGEDRFESLVAAIGDCAGWDRQRLLEAPEFRAACSHARRLQEWDVDVIHSYFPYDQSFIAAVASWLLEVPRVISLYDRGPPDNYPLHIVPFHLRHANVVYTISDEVAAGLRQLVPDSTPHLLVKRLDSVSAARSILASIAPRDQRPDVKRRTTPATTRVANWKSRPFLLVGAERTGTNLLMDVLSSNQRVANARELFNPDFLQQQYIPVDDPLIQHDAELLRLREEDPWELLQQLSAILAASGLERFGVKLLYYHGLSRNKVLTALLAERTISVIHLRRQDRLRRFVSHQRALASGNWYTTESNDTTMIPCGRLVLDPREAIADFLWVEHQEQHFRALFRGHRYLELDYEDIVGDMGNVLDHLGNFLGMDFEQVQIKSRKTGNQPFEDVVENWAEFRTELQHTQWGYLLPTDDDKPSGARIGVGHEPERCLGKANPGC